MGRRSITDWKALGPRKGARWKEVKKRPQIDLLESPTKKSCKFIDTRCYTASHSTFIVLLSQAVGSVQYIQRETDSAQKFQEDISSILIQIHIEIFLLQFVLIGASNFFRRLLVRRSGFIISSKIDKMYVAFLELQASKVSAAFPSMY